MLAAHRGTAEAAGIDWKSAVYRKVQEEVKANRDLTVERMVELGRGAGPASTALTITARHDRMAIWSCVTPSNASP